MNRETTKRLRNLNARNFCSKSIESGFPLICAENQRWAEKKIETPGFELGYSEMSSIVATQTRLFINL